MASELAARGKFLLDVGPVIPVSFLCVRSNRKTGVQGKATCSAVPIGALPSRVPE